MVISDKLLAIAGIQKHNKKVAMKTYFPVQVILKLFATLDQELLDRQNNCEDQSLTRVPVPYDHCNHDRAIFVNAK